MPSKNNLIRKVVGGTQDELVHQMYKVSDHYPPENAVMAHSAHVLTEPPLIALAITGKENGKTEDIRRLIKESIPFVNEMYIWSKNSESFMDLGSTSLSVTHCFNEAPTAQVLADMWHAQKNSIQAKKEAGESRPMKSQRLLVVIEDYSLDIAEREALKNILANAKRDQISVIVSFSSQIHSITNHFRGLFNTLILGNGTASGLSKHRFEHVKWLLGLSNLVLSYPECVKTYARLSRNNPLFHHVVFCKTSNIDIPEEYEAKILVFNNRWYPKETQQQVKLQKRKTENGTTPLVELSNRFELIEQKEQKEEEEEKEEKEEKEMTKLFKDTLQNIEVQTTLETQLVELTTDLKPAAKNNTLSEIIEVDLDSGLAKQPEDTKQKEESSCIIC